MRDASESRIALLLEMQSADGGFGARDGLPSSTEATALAALALSHERSDGAAMAATRSRAWLRATQLLDGGWPSAPGIADASWTTGLAVLALAGDEPHRDEAARGGRWLLEQRGRRIGLRPSLLDRLLGRPPIVSSDDTLVGWPWLEGTYSWVEPTSYAIVALEAVRGALPAADVAGRIDEGRRMLRDRVCPDGGWNYGNAAVYGQGLWGYPDTTALALLALRGGDGGVDASGRSLDALGRMLDVNESTLATALGVLALSAYGRDVEPLRLRLHDCLTRSTILRETRPLALAVLALNADARPFSFGATPDA
jgi:hypothetical protein